MKILFVTILAAMSLGVNVSAPITTIDTTYESSYTIVASKTKTLYATSNVNIRRLSNESSEKLGTFDITDEVVVLDIIGD